MCIRDIVGIVEFPRVEGHDRDGEGLNGHDVTVDGHADAGEDAAKVEQRRVGAALLLEEEVCGQDAADHEFCLLYTSCSRPVPIRTARTCPST